MAWVLCFVCDKWRWAFKRNLCVWKIAENRKYIFLKAHLLLDDYRKEHEISLPLKLEGLWQAQFLLRCSWWRWSNWYCPLNLRIYLENGSDFASLTEVAVGATVTGYFGRFNCCNENVKCSEDSYAKILHTRVIWHCKPAQNWRLNVIFFPDPKTSSILFWVYLSPPFLYYRL